MSPLWTLHPEGFELIKTRAHGLTHECNKMLVWFFFLFVDYSQLVQDSFVLLACSGCKSGKTHITPPPPNAHHFLSFLSFGVSLLFCYVETFKFRQKLIRNTGFTPMGRNKCNDILLSFRGACCVLHLTPIQPSNP